MNRSHKKARLRRELRTSAILLGMAAVVTFVGWQAGMSSSEPPEQEEAAMKPMNESHEIAKEAIFAGGCFWCMESIVEPLPGVHEVVSGYTGGEVADPTYEQVTSGTSGHYEAILVRYDPEQISYRTLLEVFWRHIDPTDPGGQFHDRGSQYHTAIFTLDDEQKQLAESSKKTLAASGIFDEPIATSILPAQEFYPAEAYHQDYYLKNAARFSVYRAASGREAFTTRIWEGHEAFSFFPDRKKTWVGFEKPSDETLRAMLTPLQYSVTQEKGTEPPFQNAYWNHQEKGIYVDVISGEPLFSSENKFDSGTGWPSFTQPIEPDRVVTQEDRSLFQMSIEVRSRYADSHLGHVFEDGPPPTGQRYCINSAALRFIPMDTLEEEGYGALLATFGE